MKKLLGSAVFLILWQGAALFAAKPVFPTPLAVICSLPAHGNALMLHVGFSVLRIVMGALAALLVGVPAGVLMGYFEKADRALSPVLYLAAPIPKIALLPLVMLLFGIGEFSKIFIIFFILVFQVIVTVRDGVKNIPPEVFISYRTIGAGLRQTVIDIILPASVAEIFTALRVGLATAISVLFFTETFGTRYGMGFYIMDMWMRLDYHAMYLGILTLSLIGLSFAFLLDLTEKRLCPWKQDRTKTTL